MCALESFVNKNFPSFLSESRFNLFLEAEVFVFSFGLNEWSLWGRKRKQWTQVLHVQVRYSLLSSWWWCWIRFRFNPLPEGQEMKLLGLVSIKARLLSTLVATWHDNLGSKKLEKSSEIERGVNSYHRGIWPCLIGIFLEFHNRRNHRASFNSSHCQYCDNGWSSFHPLTHLLDVQGIQIQFFSSRHNI